MNKESKTIVLLLVFSFVLGCCSQDIFASQFNPDYIIADSEMIDYQTMSLEQIQKFLEKKNSALVDLEIEDIDGEKKSAAEIIYNASQENKINPKVILVLLQKEQSLIENHTPSQYNLDWACGYHRPDGSDPDDPALQKYKGFAVQVDGAAGTLRWYIDNYPTPWLRLVGETYNFDGHQVTPQNVATVALYNYTPHYHGNYNFWKIWNEWFTTLYPNGSLLQVEGEPGIWLIQNDQRRPFLSRAAFLSRYSQDKVITVSLNDLEKYETGPATKFAQYSLLRIPSGTVYLIVDDEKRGFKSKEALMMIGFNPEEIEDVEVEDLKDYPEGEPITIESIYPTGALLQNRNTGAVYYVENGKKHGIIDRSILDIKFSNRSIVPAAEGELEKYKRSTMVKLNDGELIKGAESPAVYVIENGLKRPIISGEVFESLGYKWENILVIPQRVLDLLHPTGKIVELNY